MWVLILAAMIFVTSSVSAFSSETAGEKKKFYVLGSLGGVNYNVKSSELQNINIALVNLGFSSSTTSTDNRGAIYKIGAGLDFNQYLSLEGGYTNLGTLEIKTTTTGPSESIAIDIKPDGFEFSGLVKYHFNDKALVYGRVGMLSWRASGTVTTSLGSASESFGSGTDVTLGIGFEYDPVRIEYQNYTLGNANINTFHVSYIFKF